MKYKSYISVLSIISILVLGGGVYYWHHSHHAQSDKSQQATSNESRHLYYCPMHPSYTSDKPGQCPICGMDLVPSDLNKPDDRISITLSSDRQRLIGVKTEPIKKGKAILKIRTVATVAYNPDLAIAQREYIETKKIGDTSLTEAAKERLIALGMNEEDIKLLKTVQKGLYLKNGGSWVYPIIYEYELPYVKKGQEVIITLANGEELNGRVRSIDSVIDRTTRSARLHVEVNNETANINPSAFGTAIIKIDLGENLLVPKSAVITTGERNIAFVVHEGTHFTPAEIKLGAELDDNYIVKHGLNEGDVVVTSANFLIDSESKLKAAIGGTKNHKH